MTEKHAFLESKAVITYSRAGVSETKLFHFRAASVQLTQLASLAGSKR